MTYSGKMGRIKGKSIGTMGTTKKPEWRNLCVRMKDLTDCNRHLGTGYMRRALVPPSATARENDTSQIGL